MQQKVKQMLRISYKHLAPSRILWVFSHHSKRPTCYNMYKTKIAFPSFFLLTSYSLKPNNQYRRICPEYFKDYYVTLDSGKINTMTFFENRGQISN